MSSELRAESINCPECGSSLRAQFYDRGAIFCAACHTTFIPVGRRENQRTSRKAITSLALGCASFFLLILGGIPAVLFGVSAIRDIRRQPQTLRGMGLAISGIITGSLFGLLCSGCVGFSVLMPFIAPELMTRTENSSEIESIAAKVGEFQWPDGLVPLEAQEVRIGVHRTIVYGRRPRPVHPLVVVLQLPHGMMPSQTEFQFYTALHDADGRRGDLNQTKTSEVAFMIDGESVKAQRIRGVDVESGIWYREYTAQIRSGGSIVMIALATPDESGVPHTDRQGRIHETVSLSEESVQHFFESFHPAR